MLWQRTRIAARLPWLVVSSVVATEEGGVIFARRDLDTIQLATLP